MGPVCNRYVGSTADCVAQTHGREAVHAYLNGVLPLLQRAGGKIVKRLKAETPIHGRPRGMVLVTDFDPADSITAMFASDDHAALVPVRDRSLSEMNIQLASKR